MAYKYGKSSNEKLATCHPTLSGIAIRALEYTPYDITIVHGWRGEEVQNALFASGASQTPWPDSKHNHLDKYGDPFSIALDFAPYIPGVGIPWKETHIFACVAGCFFAAAHDFGAVLRWGGDWDNDGNTREHKLQDWGHIELVMDWD